MRKLQHELGIPPRELPLAGFRFLTRLHYCAPDTGTYGPEAEWGEHEARCPLSPVIAGQHAACNAWRRWHVGFQVFSLDTPALDLQLWQVCMP